MNTFSVICLISIILLAGGAIFYLALLTARYKMKKQIHPSNMLHGFGQKMWMTAGLGGVFFSGYLAIAAIAFYFQDPQARSRLFTFAYQHPAALIYLGLFAFACFSTTVYLVRLVIKYLYNTRRLK